MTGPLLFVMEDIVAHQLKEKQIFDSAGQPFSNISLTNALSDNSGVFKNKSGGENSEITTLLSFDKSDTIAASSQMFKIDEINLEKHIDSIADQILDFNSEECKLTKGFLPQMALNFAVKRIDYWQSPYLKEYASKPFQNLMRALDASQKQHYAKKEFNINEDPWENYLFHDAKQLIHLICHEESLPIAEQVVLSKFIIHTLETETISQYKIQGKQLMKEIINFANRFE